ncbi:hypothetical protein [Chromohalobacter israelensis]|uniref:hypothetical protein n=1 Tax=Chromohalobacter israelensis TaxID=141390 RepID=UPI001CC71190|nr:hypothetical protein [Chromohalobacter salexigens]MBZ5874742.1 hypothetical protein [Chromohalobacter salexigens]
MNAMNRWTSPRARRWIAGLTIVATTTTLAGCGSIFYPERKGQPSGRIDPAVAIADGVGLLFYIIPGVIAYAIDFSNGTIYLPSRDTAAVNTLHFDDELVRVERVASRDEAIALVRMSGVYDSERLASM